MVRAVQENNADAILTSLINGDNPNSKASNKQSVLNIVIDNIIKFQKKRDDLFARELEQVDITKLGNQIKGGLHYWYNQTKVQNRSFNNSKSLSAMGKNLSNSQAVLAKYLLYADLKTAYDKDKANIKQVMLAMYNKKSLKNERRVELRNIVRLVSQSQGDPLGSVVKEYITAKMSIDWLLMSGVNSTIKNIDGKLPGDRLTEAGLNKIGKGLNDRKVTKMSKKVKQYLSHIKEEIKNNGKTTLFMDR